MTVKNSFKVKPYWVCNKHRSIQRISEECEECNMEHKVKVENPNVWRQYE